MYFAPYERSLSPGVGWTDGDRIGYTCAFTFLVRDGAYVGQIGFVRLPQADYVVVNDAGMREGGESIPDDELRGWGGMLRPPPPPKTVTKAELCPPVLESYETPVGPIGPLPNIQFVEGLRVLETRSYANAAAQQSGRGTPWVFQIVQASNTRVTVIAYQNRVPEVAIYYESISPAVQLVSNGVQ
jgi:hypothetical protein